MVDLFSTTGFVFFVTIAATFFVTFLARSHSKKKVEQGLASENLNKWMIGLSAGATANSGFVVTAAVGLGYTYGMQWVLLPLAWLLGDIVFWKYFPQRINDRGRKVKASTITDLITSDMKGSTKTWISILVGITVLVCLTGYTSAQWIAGQKFVSGAFGLPSYVSLALFGIVIIAYTAIGGFRGSIYADSLQAIVRILGTIVALAAVVFIAKKTPDVFSANIEVAGPDFLNLFGMGGIVTLTGFIIGIAAAAFGFGLGQPQIITRYLAGKSSDETQAAWWIYLSFVQFTWIAMTVFGVILRGVMPDISDPEAGLSVFFVSNFGALLTGVIVADIFATIAATTNSLLIAMGQSLKNDILKLTPGNFNRFPLGVYTLTLGLISMVIASMIGGTVFDLALGSVSLMAAGLAPAVMIKVLSWKSTSASITFTIFLGIITAVVWKKLGYNSIINEAAPGISAGLLANFLFYHFSQLGRRA